MKLYIRWGVVLPLVVLGFVVTRRLCEKQILSAKIFSLPKF
jgi:hypothetical protein